MDASHTGHGPRSSDDVRAAQLADLCGAWVTDATGAAHPDWLRLRAFADRLHAHPGLVASAITAEPAPSGWPVLDVLLAAVAEKLADDAGIARPAWCADRPALSEAWTVPTRPTKHAEAVAATPDQFARRGLFVPSTAIWRRRPDTASLPAT